MCRIVGIIKNEKKMFRFQGSMIFFPAPVPDLPKISVDKCLWIKRFGKHFQVKEL